MFQLGIVLALCEAVCVLIAYFSQKCDDSENDFLWRFQTTFDEAARGEWRKRYNENSIFNRKMIFLHGAGLLTSIFVALVGYRLGI